jgi:acetamidase/formamidase
MAIKTIHDIRNCFDHSIAPLETIESGERRRFDVVDASGGLVTHDAQAEVLTRLPADQLNPICGPLYIADAEPGDVIEIALEDFEPSGWGWTGQIPGFGLLADDFPEPWLHHSPYDGEYVHFTDDIRVPYRPFAGVIGLAPAAPGKHSILPPRACGGNLDIRDLVAGASLYLPVEVAGGLLSIGDTHACQGDGEICGTAVETAMAVTASVHLHKRDALSAPMFDLPATNVPDIMAAGAIATTGVGPDLMASIKEAAKFMIDRLTRVTDLDAQAAYGLCSIAAQLRISEVVDAPNWVVSYYMPKSIFTSKVLRAI